MFTATSRTLSRSILPSLSSSLPSSLPSSYSLSSFQLSKSFASSAAASPSPPSSPSASASSDVPPITPEEYIKQMEEQSEDLKSIFALKNVPIIAFATAAVIYLFSPSPETKHQRALEQMREGGHH